MRARACEHTGRPGPGRRASAIFFSAAVGSLSLLLASPVDAQRAGRKAGDRCDELVKAARDARSLEGLRDRIERERLSDRVLEACAEDLRRDPRVAEILEWERRQHRSRAARRARIQRAAPPESPEQLEVNRRVLEARRAASYKRRIRESQAPKPRRSSAPTPAIDNITPSPVVPGTDIVIEGVGFGDGAGTVRLELQGQTSVADVNTWTETWISAYLSDDISGVTETADAVIEIQAQDGSSLRRTVSFVPIYESVLVYWEANVMPWPLPADHHQTFAHGVHLENGWRLSSEPWIDSMEGVECEIEGPPAAEPGDTDLATRVHVAWDWFELPKCAVLFEIEGPTGFDHGIEDHRRLR